MANITELHPIRYAQDIAKFSYSDIVINNSKAIDLSNADNVTQIIVSTLPATLPEDVSCKIAFISDNNDSGWFKLNSNGEAVTLATQSITDYSILNEGNTISELTALTRAPALAGNRIRYAIAMSCENPEEVNPAIKIEFKCSRGSNKLANTYESQIFNFTDNIIVTGIEQDSNTTGAGTLNVKARWFDTSNQVMTDWADLSNLAGVTTNQIQYQVNAAVTQTGGSDSSVLNSITARYNLGSAVTTGNGSSEIISIIKDWRRDLRHCRILVKHAPLENNSIKTYFTLRGKTTKIHNEILGSGTGTRANYTLAHVNGLNVNSLIVYVNNQVTASSNYDINSSTGVITLEAALGSIITCSYEYGWEPEEWQELELDYRESFDEYDLSVYKITLPENTSGIIKSMGAVKIALTRTQGSSELELLGKGTGVSKTYRLNNLVTSNLRIYFNGILQPSSVYSLESNMRYISVTAPVNVDVRTSYNWITESPTLYEFSSIFSE